MNILLIDGIPYPIGARVQDAHGNIGVITKYDVVSQDDDRPLKVDFMGQANCGHFGPCAKDKSRRVTLAEPITYPEKPETLRRAGPEWGNLGTLEDEHNVAIDGEVEPEAYTLEA